MGIITDYLTLQKKHELQYGERTVVLIQQGSFYEIYEYDPSYCTSDNAKIDSDGKIWNECIGHAIEMSATLNCFLTHENSNKPYGISNTHKVGFPMIAYEKNRATILNADYVIIRVDQHKNMSGPITRFVAEVCSPTMSMDNITPTRPTSNIACIYIEYQHGLNKFDNFLITTGVSVIDIITGQNRVCEFYSKTEDEVHAVQELYRFLISHYPRELIVHLNDMPEALSKHTESAPNPYVKHLEKVLELRRFDRLNIHVNQVSPEYKKIPYQIEFLNKIFTIKENQQPTTGIRLNVIQKRNERIIEELGLERMNYGRIAYMLLMQHCHSHNVEIIAKLSKPDLQWIDAKKHLILTHNAIVQLDLIPDGGKPLRLQKKKEIDSLMSVLDQNQTHLGRRLLHNILQNPMLDPNDINAYYNMIDEMLSAKVESDPLWLSLERSLKELPDIARLQRKLEIKLITPKELSVLYQAYIKVISIYICILNTKSPTLHKHLFNQEDSANFNQFISRYASIINFETLECCYIDTSADSNTKWIEFTECPIRPGVYQDIDDHAKLLFGAESNLQQIIDHLNIFLARTTGKKLAFRSAKKKQGATKQDPTGTVLTTTEAKAKTLINSPIDTNICGILQVIPYTSAERIITSDRISALCAQIDQIRTWMRQRLLTIYEFILDEMNTKYTFYVPVANLVAKIDLIHSYAKISYRYNYIRPDLVINDSNISFLEAKDIRHPIIERMINGAYVTNDIYLGASDVEVQTNDAHTIRTDGMLLYGVNKTGKSSLAKAVALNIIMAQAGCYTPSQLRYKPYSKIITRLSGSDNIFKGQSSFEVEMMELRTILRQADSSTLIIGDELCKGTESHSGTAITTSAILSLIQKRASFIFATHMHEMLKLSYINQIEPRNLKICHLSISYDETSKILVYDRKIKDGAGASIYGLIVARSLDLPRDFIDKSYEILLEITGENRNIVETTRSRYNTDVYVDSCAMCGKPRQQTELHTHHLEHQADADARGMIGNIHKNIKDNLIVLCRDCHVKLHHDNKDLVRVETSAGKLVIAVET